ncbi:aquaporin family protein [Epilithonimonas vandammei]|uniref:Aquaporin family protein n=2 Tax=Epilithonimonas TaxID=2782229 RepID=A0A3G8Y0Q9_9FLAO|nr:MULTISPECIES: MIP/aquaporin family protein [Epilithonimonas]AZI38453.1 aquaporin family protein [Epilithonimonas vandammei]AZI54212.1 aquaporin family protein [Epilithonimonas vandammei]ROI12583.1 aquaporin family protein [Epilithonimonas hominis]
MSNIFIAELLGTLILILLGNGVVANVLLQKTKGNGAGLIVITAGWAFAVFSGAAVALNLGSAAHLNPAVSIATFIGNGITSTELISYLGGEFLGAMAGAFLVWLMYKDHFDATFEDPGAQLACYSTGPAIKNTWSNLFSEALGTFVLIFVSSSFASTQGETVGSIGLWPITTLIWAIGVSLGGTTGYAINPARDLGPRIMHAILPIKGKGTSDWGYAWIPVIGPIVGAILAILAYQAIH